ncbi:GNAT family N-acetyltransferase [Coleofasciculus sp. FACHB-712]|uniref:GNAT family N-acetyltransferase n=1 Tax=Coleofasciculus sp. FACHB-712 TaxID=2692789 RepID=UPI0016886FDE|nr:GNAT family N-acetyltransferase [Coleofasciculus sp. FACHB-712]MBD1945402.1 GNAT family N-acetyltransferase [Coleofasciculus sp. FACHB-712]
MNQYRFKRSFSTDSSLSNKLFDLVEIVFSGIGELAECGRKLGASWEEASTPFIRFHEDIAITHIGVLEIPMQIMGQRVTVGGIHGVCTRAEFRRRGYYREVMEEVLEYCDKRYEALVLTTPNPEFYTPFGFRKLEEYVFKIRGESQSSRDGFRILNFDNDKDLKLLHRLLETRIPVSNIVGVVKEKAVFCFNEGSHPIYYAEDLDLIACMEIKETQLHLFDIVATQICPLKEIINRIPQTIEDVTIYFSPELLDLGDITAFPHTFDETVLMVRGKFAAEGEKFMLPRSARC